MRALNAGRYALLAVVVAFVSCAQPAPSPFPAPTLAEQQQVQALGFPSEVLAAAREVGGNFRQLQGSQEDGTNFPARGITVEVPTKEASARLDKLRATVRSLGYEAYLAEMNFGQEPDKLAIVPAGEKFAFLRLRGTNGANHDITPAQVLARVQAWDRLYGLELDGADFDWVQLRFVRQPTDLLAFAKEVYEFCPDVVDQGTETIERLANEMRQSNSVFLWWD